jgi:DNA-binding transcriptional MerR regulator
VKDEKFMKEIAEIKKLLEKKDQEFHALRLTANSKASLKQVSEIEENLKNMATVEDYSNIKSKMTEWD